MEIWFNIRVKLLSFMFPTMMNPDTRDQMEHGSLDVKSILADATPEAAEERQLVDFQKSADMNYYLLQKAAGVVEEKTNISKEADKTVKGFESNKAEFIKNIREEAYGEVMADKTNEFVVELDKLTQDSDYSKRQDKMKLLQKLGQKTEDLDGKLISALNGKLAPMVDALAVKKYEAALAKLQEAAAVAKAAMEVAKQEREQVAAVYKSDEDGYHALLNTLKDTYAKRQEELKKEKIEQNKEIAKTQKMIAEKQAKKTRLEDPNNFSNGEEKEIADFESNKAEFIKNIREEAYGEVMADKTNEFVVELDKLTQDSDYSKRQDKMKLLEKLGQKTEDLDGKLMSALHGKLAPMVDALAVKKYEAALGKVKEKTVVNLNLDITQDQTEITQANARIAQIDEMTEKTTVRLNSLVFRMDGSQKRAGEAKKYMMATNSFEGTDDFGYMAQATSSEVNLDVSEESEA